MAYIKRAAEDTIARVSKNVSGAAGNWPQTGWKNDLIAKNGRGTAKVKA